jgi:predicted porin
MKRSLKLLVLPAALWTAGAAAQSNVAVYGIVDVGLARESGTPSGKATNLNSGLASGSRLGLKGSEDLGGAMKANFVLENGFNADTGISGQGGQMNNANATDHVNNSILVASYDAGALIVHAAGAVNRGPGLADSRDITAGVTVPFGVQRLLLSIVRHDDRTTANKDARQWGIGYLRALSKRTDLYASYATIANRNGASFTVGNATDKGTGSRALDLGLRHTF